MTYVKGEDCHDKLREGEKGRVEERIVRRYKLMLLVYGLVEGRRSC